MRLRLALGQGRALGTHSGVVTLGRSRVAVRRLGPMLHAALLLLLGSQALHHLRYLVAPDHERGLTLAHHGEATHLILTGPVIAIATALAVAAFVARAAAAPPELADRSTRVRRIWPLVTLALLATYGSQELLEGWLGHGHEGGIEALAASGGWVVVPLAVALAGLVTLAVRITRAVVALARRADVWFVVLMPAPRTRLVGGLDTRPARPVLSEHRAGRAPPVMA